MTKSIYTLEMIKPKIEQVLPRIFHVSFENRFDTAMTFLRAQEYYEGVDPWFRQPFKISSYMIWYARERGEGDFSYANDWAGFNVPGWVLRNFYERRHGFMDTLLPHDWTPYDNLMFDLTIQAQRLGDLHEDDWNFYLLGTTDTDDKSANTLRHEIAHGLYYTNPEYKAQMDECVALLKEETRETWHKNLVELGYNEAVVVDEIQAYCSTGEKYEDDEEYESFRQVFKKFYKAAKSSKD